MKLKNMNHSRIGYNTQFEIINSDLLINSGFLLERERERETQAYISPAHLYNIISLNKNSFIFSHPFIANIVRHSTILGNTSLLIPETKLAFTPKAS